MATRKQADLVDLPDLLEKTYKKLDAYLDREDLSFKDFVQVVRAIAYLKGTAGKPPPLRRGADDILKAVVSE